MEVKMKKKILIEGMHCASCATNVERSLKKLPGVESAAVSMMTRKAIVEVDERVKDEDLKKAVARAGYKAVSIE
ncbi:heavy metal transport/detoxification protein [Candidatus Pacearchaeota archaeon CG10_big_fil_rev_8_21_14_0_10_32_42]|nr:MAG: heavy metal transport/detoxification protein [Candidatus Pacearchaeota archaeon CG10_big_fil_rev_8_21_14_0_10_32_42]